MVIKMKLLIAEDDPISRHMLEKTLKYWGYEVISVNDGAMALMFLYINNPPNVIILDWEMPKIDGINLCEKIRGDADRKDIYIMIITARSAKEDMMEAYRSGVDDFLTKPVTAEDLKKSIETAIEVTAKGVTPSERRELRLRNINSFLERKGLPLV
jgi:DNA-binding response OmpR family regulator